MHRDRAIFDIAEPIGLFATLYYVAAIVRGCEEQGIDPWIEGTNSFYVDAGRGRDWFDYYFDRAKGVVPPPEDCPRHRIRSRRKLNKLLRGTPHVDMQNELCDFRDAGRDLEKHLRVKPELAAAADAFANEQFDGRTLGIHWRSGDKVNHEADPIPLELMRRVIARHAGDMQTIFVATDDPAFSPWVRTTLPEHRVVTYSAQDGRTFDEDYGDNYGKGREAMLDCLLLARCDRMVKTPSVLSAWSKVFNPELPVVLVGQPYRQLLRWRLRLPGLKLRFKRWHARPLRGVGYFPESVLHERSAMERNGVLEIVPSSDRPLPRRYG